MILGIDAANLRVGGGLTHLIELLRAAHPQAHGFSQIVVWGGTQTLTQLEERPWLLKAPQPLLNKRLPCRAFWQHFRLTRLARSAGCSILFAPGGSVSSSFHPVVTMSRNLLPFEWQELRRYGVSRLTLKWLLLRIIQSRAFRRADGLIFLTRYASQVVSRVVALRTTTTAIIPHGIDRRFMQQPRAQRPIGQYSDVRPFRILYVSIIDMYKHQWCVAEAVARLRAGGVPLVLELIGPAYPPALARLNAVRRRADPRQEFLLYAGGVAHAELHARYAAADLCVFASSCENMPNILLEAMASGLPIACSNRGPMPEVLGDAGSYFDPEDCADIARVLQALLRSPEERARLAAKSFARVQAYSWERCAAETFGFLAAVAAAHTQRAAGTAVAASSPRGA